jgi:hypothetical protein
LVSSWTVDQEAGQQCSIEPVREAQVLDPATHRGRAMDVIEHFPRLVDGDYPVTQLDERICHPADAGSQIEHGGVGGQLCVHDLGLAAGRQRRVHLHGTAVSRDRAGTRPIVGGHPVTVPRSSPNRIGPPTLDWA